MRKIALGIGCLILLVSGAFAQNNSQMSLSTEEHGPGDRLTLFITFKEPMLKLESINCYFELSTALQTRQTGFQSSISCENNGQPPKKDSETAYRVVLPISENIATGGYTLRSINITVAGITKSYQGNDLPPFAPLKVRNPKDDPNFAPIKDLKVQ
jgi:hypothetical protein